MALSTLECNHPMPHCVKGFEVNL